MSLDPAAYVPLSPRPDGHFLLWGPRELLEVKHPPAIEQRGATGKFLHDLFEVDKYS